MDISNLTYKELEALEEKIKERKKIMAEAEYIGLVNEVLNAINVLLIHHATETAYYDEDGWGVFWDSLYNSIKECLKKREIFGD